MKHFEHKNIQIRVASLGDAPRLIEIYKPYILHTVITYEYEVPSVDEFENRIQNTLKTHPYLVAIIDGLIVGYAYAVPYIGRKACDWSVETSIYIDTEYRGYGVGRALYEALEDALRAMNVLNLNAAIATPYEEDEYLNLNSVKFHQHMGYEVVGEFRNCGYKFGKWYKLLWMEKMLGEHSSNPLPVRKFPEVLDTMNLEDR